MDRTELFKAVVKTVRLRLRAQRKDTGSLNEIVFQKQTSKETSEFGKLAKNTCNHITALKKFLSAHRKDYIDVSGYLSKEFSHMADEERDLIDSEVQELIKKASEYFGGLQKILTSNDGSTNEQCQEHRQAVLSLLRLYIKDVTKLYSGQKAVRIKRIVDRKRTTRLVPEGRRNQSIGLLPSTHERLEEPNINSNDHQHQFETIPSSVNPTNTISNNTSVQLTTTNTNDGMDNSSYNDTFTSEEVVTFQQENAVMFDQMSSLADEVRMIESKVVEITRLQEVFSEKVLEQAENLDTVHQTTVTATENVKEGNEQIRSAIRNQGSVRMWILFILVVLSFTLLFLDWYS